MAFKHSKVVKRIKVDNIYKVVFCRFFLFLCTCLRLSDMPWQMARVLLIQCVKRRVVCGLTMCMPAIDDSNC